MSHVDSKVNDEFIQWIRDTFGAIGEVKVTRGKVHDYLGMILDYRVKGQVTIDMTRYVESMVDSFPQEELQGKVSTPWNENLFKVNDMSNKLSMERAELFHTTTAQGLFLCKQAATV